MVVVRKNLSVEKGEQVLFDDVRYFFYITNDRDDAGRGDRAPGQRPVQPGEPDRAAQERGPGAAVPVDNLVSNWAYMVMASLAWTLKAWFALLLPRDGPLGRAARGREAGGA